MKLKNTILFFLILHCIFLFSDDRKSQVLIAINEVCIIPIKEGYPKWVELKSNSKEKINLNGYSLWDREKCIFKFNGDYFVNPKAYVLICFYSSGENSKEFENSLDENIKLINLFNTEVFIPMKPIPFPKNYEILYGKHDDFFIKMRLSMLPDKYLLEYKQQAEEIIKNYKLPLEQKDNIIAILSMIAPYFNEVSIVDNQGKVDSFVSWAGYETTEYLSLRVKMAIDKSPTEKNPICLAVPYEAGYHPAKLQPIIFERYDDNYYVFDPYYASPGTAFSRKGFKNFVFEINLSDKQLELRSSGIECALSNWDIEIEVAGDKDFKDILLKKKLPIQNSCKVISKLDKNLLIQLERYKDKTVYYRIRRSFPDETFSKWQTGKAIDILTDAEGWKTYYQ